MLYLTDGLAVLSYVSGKAGEGQSADLHQSGRSVPMFEG